MLVRWPLVMRVMPDTSGPSSSTATSLPACVSWYAVLRPAMPAPTMQTSTCRFSSSGRHSGRRALADQTDSWRGMVPRALQKTLLGRLFPHGDELLGHRRMDADGGVELRLGGADLYRDCQALDDLARVRPDHVRADYPLRGALDHQLHEDALLSLRQREFQRSEIRLVNIDFAIALARLQLAQPDGGEVGIGEHRGRHVVMVHGRRLAAEEGLREPHRFGGRDRREVDAVGDVTDRVDRLDARARVLVDDHRAVGREFHPGALEAELGAIRLAAGGEEHEVGLLVRPVGIADLETVGVLDDLRRLAAEVDLEPFVRQLLGNALAEIGVEAAQQAPAPV